MDWNIKTMNLSITDDEVEINRYFNMPVQTLLQYILAIEYSVRTKRLGEGTSEFSAYLASSAFKCVRILILALHSRSLALYCRGYSVQY